MPRFGLLTAANGIALVLFQIPFPNPPKPPPNITKPPPNITKPPPNPHQTPTEPPCYSQIWAAANSFLVLFQIPLPNPHQTPTKPPPNSHAIPRFGLNPIKPPSNPCQTPTKPPPNPHAMPMNGTRKLEKGLMGANIVPFRNTF